MIDGTQLDPIALRQGSDGPWWRSAPRFVRSAAEAWRQLDRDDLNYAASSLRIGVDATQKVSMAMLLIRGCGNFFGRWARAATTQSTLDPETYRGKVMAGVASHNQRRVVDALVRSVGDVDGEPRMTALVTKRIGVQTRLPLAAAYGTALRHSPDLFAAARRAPPELRRAWAAHASEYALTTGLYVMCRQWLAKAEPAAVLVSNDHMMRTRVLVEAARDEGIPTVYVQHAAVTARFPPLRTDIALLDGVAAAANYLNAGPSHTRVFLTGSPLHDGLTSMRIGPRGGTRLGICLNLLDRPEAVRQIVDVLAVAAVPPIEIRTHPRDDRNWNAWLPNGVAKDVRSARDEGMEDFLARVSVVVAGDSSVHLEAALAGVPSVYAGALGTGRDAYGFVAAGLVPLAATTVELEHAILSAEPAPSDACRHFDATVGTSWSGQSGALIRSVLGHIVRGEAEPPSMFPHVATIGGTTIHALDAQDLVALEGLHAERRP